MADSMAHAAPEPVAPAPRLHGWQTAVGFVAAVVLAVLFLSSGLWKLLDPIAWSERLVQALVPRQLALPGALGVGLAETLAGVLVLVPRWRRWGAWIAIALLLVFMAYFGINYSRLQGEDCSCFPWLKRVVGPMFFLSDAAMLVLAGLAAWWSRASSGFKQALMTLGVLAVFAAANLGYSTVRDGGVVAPASITVDGKPFALREGRVFVYFFDPQCMHCFDAAVDMGAYKWKSDVRVVAVPTREQQWGTYFLNRTRFHAAVSLDEKLLRQSFKFTDPPYAVALDGGRLKKALPYYDQTEPRKSLKELGWIE